MKLLSVMLLLTYPILAHTPPTAYDQYPVYTGRDLGLTYSHTASTFRIWSPPAQQAQLLLYKNDHALTPFRTIGLDKGVDGTWHTRLTGDWKGTQYTFHVKIGDTWYKEVPDPYAKAVGINGKRAVIVDPADTDPPGWKADKSPAFSATGQPTDAVIYELHIRDASMDSSSGIREKGKFNGLAQWGTMTGDGFSTGLTHIKELGVTHIHLLPFFDYSSVDESKSDSPQYNWGYDPLNYNAPEGSYSTDPYDAAVRIRELKQLIATLHRHGLRVIMDVVYNHTALTDSSNFNQLVPGYYYRHNKDNSFSNATGCGNETASERPMMRKFMLESVLYWAREYHVDGFRFDLMGVHDLTTMNLISDSLHRIRPDILLYGEGWTAGSSPLPDSLRALKSSASRLHRIAVFSDDIRDAIKGSVFDSKDRGFASGGASATEENRSAGLKESIKFGIAAACYHPQIDYSKVNYSKAPYADAPGKVITYCECHDNNTLWDKLAISCPDATREDRKKMQRLALTIVLTSQGTPFLHAGTEFLRSKEGVENSYNAGDSINALRWDLKKENADLVQYIRQLIHLRRGHSAFRMTTAAQIAKYLHFEDAPRGAIAYTLNGAALHDEWKTIFVAFNGTGQGIDLRLPPGDQPSGNLSSGNWRDAFSSPGSASYSNTLHLDAYSSIILYKK